MVLSNLTPGELSAQAAAFSAETQLAERHSEFRLGL
jgi:hypothetical protein